MLIAENKLSFNTKTNQEIFWSRLYLAMVLISFCCFHVIFNGYQFFQFMFQQLGFLVGFAKQHVRNFLGEIFQLIRVCQFLILYCTVVKTC